MGHHGSEDDALLVLLQQRLEVWVVAQGRQGATSGASVLAVGRGRWAQLLRIAGGRYVSAAIRIRADAIQNPIKLVGEYRFNIQGSIPRGVVSLYGKKDSYRIYRFRRTRNPW